MALTTLKEGPASLDPQTAIYVPLGAASPLWLLFGGAASAGLAYWWMTRWADRSHLEALLGRGEVTGAALEPDPAPARAPAVDVVESVQTAAVDGAAVVVETASAPLEAVAETEPAPKSRAKVRPVEPPPA